MRYLFCLLTGLVLLQSCFKERSHEVEPLPEIITNPWSFSVDGISYNGEIRSVKIDSAGGMAILHIEGIDTAGIGRFQLLVTADSLAPGEYKSPAAAFLYAEDVNPIYQSESTTDNFTVVLSEISGIMVSGSFSGLVQTPAGATLPISNASFSNLR